MLFYICNSILCMYIFFFQKYTEVPETPLYTGQMLKEGEEIWSDVQDEMMRSLASMRVDYDQVQIKSIKNLNNPLIEKRKKKKKLFLI